MTTLRLIYDKRARRPSFRVAFIYGKSSRSYFYIAFHIITDLREIAFHAVGIFVVDDLQQLLQLRTDLGDLIVRVGVKEDFLQQIVILVKYALGNAHVTLEGGTWCILILHDSRKHKR